MLSDRNDRVGVAHPSFDEKLSKLSKTFDKFHLREHFFANMCCCFGKGRICRARWWHSAIYLFIGCCCLFGYLGLSIAFYIECYSLVDDSPMPIQCGSNAMWSCVGWVPLFFFLIISTLTFYYLYRQSNRTMKVLTSSRAWLILFVTVAGCVLFFIHICYLAFVYFELYDNDACDPSFWLNLALNNSNKFKQIDCSDALSLLSGLLFCSIASIIFICTSLTLLFALVNGRIATPVNYKTVKQFEPGNSVSEMEMEDTSLFDDYSNGANGEPSAVIRSQRRLRQRVCCMLNSNVMYCCGLMWTVLTAIDIENPSLLIEFEYSVHTFSRCILCRTFFVDWKHIAFILYLSITRFLQFQLNGPESTFHF